MRYTVYAILLEQIAQIVLGGLSIFLAIVSLIIASVGYLDGFAFVSTGIWCDALVSISDQCEYVKFVVW